MGTGKKYSKAQSRILELEKALNTALQIIQVQANQLKEATNGTTVSGETLKKPLQKGLLSFQRQQQRQYNG